MKYLRKSKFSKIVVFILVFLFACEQTTFAAQINVRDAGNIGWLDVTLSIFAGFMQAAQIDPSWGASRIFISTYLIPLATDKLIKALHIKNRALQMAISVGINVAANKGLDMKGVGTGGAGNAPRGNPAFKIMAKLGKILNKAFLKIAAKLGSKAAQGALNKIIQQEAAEFASKTIQEATQKGIQITQQELLNALIQKFGQELPKETIEKIAEEALNKALKQTLSRAAQDLTEEAINTGTEVAKGTIGEITSTAATQTAQSAISVSIWKAMLYKGIQGATYGAVWGALSSAIEKHNKPLSRFLATAGALLAAEFTGLGLSKATGIVFDIPTNSEQQYDKEAINKETGKKVLDEALSKELKEFSKQYLVRMTGMGVETAAAMAGIQEAGIVFSAGLTRMLQDKLYKTNDKNKTDDKIKETFYKEMLKGLASGLISVALQRISLETKSPVHGAYFNLFVSTLVRAALMENVEGKGFSFYKAQIGVAGTYALADMMSMGRGTPELTADGKFSLKMRGMDVFFMARYSDYIWDVHKYGLATAMTNQLLSSIHYQSVSNVADILQHVLYKANRAKTSPLIETYADPLGERRRQVSEKLKNSRYQEESIDAAGKELKARENLTKEDVLLLKEFIEKGAANMSSEQIKRLVELGAGEYKEGQLKPNQKRLDILSQGRLSEGETQLLGAINEYYKAAIKYRSPAARLIEQRSNPQISKPVTPEQQPLRLENVEPAPQPPAAPIEPEPTTRMRVITPPVEVKSGPLTPIPAIPSSEITAKFQPQKQIISPPAEAPQPPTKPSLEETAASLPKQEGVQTVIIKPAPSSFTPEPQQAEPKQLTDEEKGRQYKTALDMMTLGELERELIYAADEWKPEIERRIEIEKWMTAPIMPTPSLLPGPSSQHANEFLVVDEDKVGTPNPLDQIKGLSPKQRRVTEEAMGSFYDVYPNAATMLVFTQLKAKVEESSVDKKTKKELLSEIEEVLKETKNLPGGDRKMQVLTYGAVFYMNRDDQIRFIKENYNNTENPNPNPFLLRAAILLRAKEITAPISRISETR